MKKIVVIVLCLSSIFGFAQQEPMFTHYTFNISSINPAYVGQHGILSVSAINRSQWVGFNGYPITQNVNIHSPVFNKMVGAGLNLMHDRIGPTRTTGLFGDLATRVKLGPGKLAFGLKLGLRFRSNELGSIATNQPNDPNFSANIQTENLPNVGFGLFYSTAKYYGGFSMPSLIRSKLDGEWTGIGDDPNRLERYMYFIAGGVFDLKKDGTLKIRPSLLFRTTKGARPQLDISALIYYKNLFWVGPMFRTCDAFGVLGGVKISEQFSAGYSFDWSFGLNTGRYNGGSHEVMLRYDFIFKQRGRIESPRYF